MNKKTIPFFLLLAALFTIVYSSCKKPDDIKSVADNQAYYPLEIGKYIIYDVDSTIWDDTNCVKIERHYQMRYTVRDTFTDAMGRPSKRVEIATRHLPGDDWKNIAQSVFYVTNTGQELEVVHSGQRFIKMVYPVSEGRTWLGNAYIKTDDADLAFFKNWTYRYINVGQSNADGGINYNNTVSVLAIDETINDPYPQPRDPARRTYSKEVFAPGIGMVYREYYRWNYDPTYKNNNDANNLAARCLKGDGVVMTAVDHN